MPARTNLKLSTVNGESPRRGDRRRHRGDSVNGEIMLTDVAGAVVAHATNGEVRVDAESGDAGQADVVHVVQRQRRRHASADPQSRT